MRVEKRTAKKGYVCIDCKKKIAKGEQYYHFARGGRLNEAHISHGDPVPPKGGSIKWIGKAATASTKKKVTKKKVAKKPGKKKVTEKKIATISIPI